jgi:hypothetical protein
MANQFWLIGPLAPHMDGLFFFLQKLANYRFSEACCEVGAELEHSWQQFQLNISTKSHITRKVRILLLGCNGRCGDGQGQRWTLSAICFLLLLEYDQIVITIKFVHFWGKNA